MVERIFTLLTGRLVVEEVEQEVLAVTLLRHQNPVALVARGALALVVGVLFLLKGKMLEELIILLVVEAEVETKIEMMVLSVALVEMAEVAVEVEVPVVLQGLLAPVEGVEVDHQVEVLEVQVS